MFPQTQAQRVQRNNSRRSGARDGALGGHTGTLTPPTRVAPMATMLRVLSNNLSQVAPHLTMYPPESAEPGAVQRTSNWRSPADER